MGQSSDYNDDCSFQDHLVVDLNGGDADAEHKVVLCGNLTSLSYRTSFMSLQEKIQIRVVSPIGKSGRGFLGRFKAVPNQLVETLSLATSPNSSLSLTSINYPMTPPENINLTLAISSPPNYVLNVNINGTSSCSKTAKSYLEIRDPYHGTNGTTWKLCQLDMEASSEGPNKKMSGGGLNLLNENGDSNANNKMRHNEISLGITQMNTVISFRSTFNRLDIRQVYSPSFQGKTWNLRVVTVLGKTWF